MKEWTVIGIYADNQQRFADTYEAPTAQEAEQQAVGEASSDLLVAGVIEGFVPLADVDYAGHDD